MSTNVIDDSDIKCCVRRLYYDVAKAKAMAEVVSSLSCIVFHKLYDLIK